ncbi:HRDC domain-containing protein [Arthrobacter crystallopoietes]|uniref:Ribonuclease D n=1 Tax=Crystallibacter crystallopoietes TaxID=37928 RepID=A0A1H1GUC2_9MICC|nr:ribonuclease D [Arthrobacter crystallopoietes]AUI52353.1 ribonuclease D [Arthrobacter crystallopoietes]SDR16804.1 ribonuclease D [Arthrobacter crystallopoietes]
MTFLTSDSSAAASRRADSTATASDEPEQDAPELIELTAPREGVPLVISTQSGLHRAAAALAAGSGPVAVDAERASGFRYGQRAFLVQLRREGAGTWLIDPEPFDDLEVINDALRGVEWILHAATQDLPCLAALGMWPDKLFDTELAARLAGLPRVGLAAVIENLLGFTLAKEHSAADWSTRPLPEPWLRYAALDVEVLVELREALVAALEESGKLPFAEEEFEALLAAPPAAPRTDPWRRTSGLHQIRDRRQLAAVRELWTEREQLAEKRDVAPGRLIPDSAMVAAARAMPATVPQLLAVNGFHGRAAQREAPRWLRCIDAARRLEKLPELHMPTNAPPPPRVWADKDPAAAARLQTAKPRLAALAEELQMPVENLLTPDYLRRIAWRPPTPVTAGSIAEALRDLGARNWQRELAVPVITEAFLHPEPLAERKPKADEADPKTGSRKR